LAQLIAPPSTIAPTWLAQAIAVAKLLACVFSGFQTEAANEFLMRKGCEAISNPHFDDGLARDSKALGFLV